MGAPLFCPISFNFYGFIIFFNTFSLQTTTNEIWNQRVQIRIFSFVKTPQDNQLLFLLTVVMDLSSFAWIVKPRVPRIKSAKNLFQKVTFHFSLILVWELQQGLFSIGEFENSFAISHRRKAVRLRVPGLHQSLQQRVWPSQTSEPNTFQRGNSKFLTVTQFI